MDGAIGTNEIECCQLCDIKMRVKWKRKLYIMMPSGNTGNNKGEISDMISFNE